MTAKNAWLQLCRYIQERTQVKVDVSAAACHPAGQCWDESSVSSSRLGVAAVLVGQRRRMKFYWKASEIPELADLPSSVRRQVWRAALRRAMFRWTTLAATFVFILLG